MVMFYNNLMHLIILILGIFSIIYGIYSLRKRKIIIPVRTFSIYPNWFREPYLNIAGKKARILSIGFIFFGVVVILNYVLIINNIVVYP